MAFTTKFTLDFLKVVASIRSPTPPHLTLLPLYIPTQTNPILI